MGVSVPTLPLSIVPSANPRQSHSGFSELLSSGVSRKARVLYDYDAAGSNELSLLADEVSACFIILSLVDLQQHK